MEVNGPVHPHACGDDAPLNPNGSQRSGSPPRVWGRRALESEWKSTGRFTPTRVGTTRPCIRMGVNRAVHPHACGDDYTLTFIAAAPGGSPPRVWGRPGNAGNDCGDNAVHPHACGDDREKC